jgi:hypothetical protein
MVHVISIVSFSFKGFYGLAEIVVTVPTFSQATNDLSSVKLFEHTLRASKEPNRFLSIAGD